MACQIAVRHVKTRYTFSICIHKTPGLKRSIFPIKTVGLPYRAGAWLKTTIYPAFSSGTQAHLSSKRYGVNQPSLFAYLQHFSPLGGKNHLKNPGYCCPVPQLRLTLYNAMDCSTPGLPVLHHLPESTQTHGYWVSDAIQPSRLWSPLLLLPSIFPSIRVFSNESPLHIRWPKYQSFSFSINTFSKYSGLISFKIDWFDILAVQGTLKSLL